jgi:hypothetical protein
MGLYQDRPAIRLLPQSETGDGRPIAIDILIAEVCQEAPPSANQLQESASRVMILPVLSQMVSQTVDPLGQQGNLNLWRASVRLMNPKT